jgi:hypothetical protein
LSVDRHVVAGYPEGVVEFAIENVDAKQLAA